MLSRYIEELAKFVIKNPDLPMTEEWTDEKLYEKYGLDQEEIDIIEGMIKEMK